MHCNDTAFRRGLERAFKSVARQRAKRDKRDKRQPQKPQQAVGRK